MVDLNYFISSLPMLLWGEKPRLEYAAFISQCRELLDKSIAERVQHLQLLPGNEASQDTIATAWREFETFLRNVTSQIRQAKYRRGGERFENHATRYFSVLSEHRLQEIMQLTSPVERESQLDRIRWEFLDTLSVGHRADIEGLELYALRLMLLEKIHSRQLQAGKELFTEMVDAGLAEAEARRLEE